MPSTGDDPDESDGESGRGTNAGDGEERLDGEAGESSPERGSHDGESTEERGEDGQWEEHSGDHQHGHEPIGDDSVITERPEADPIEGTGPVGSRQRPDRSLRGYVRWFVRTDRLSVAFLREFLGSALAVLLVGALLFAISGVWPPMVAVKSGSMEPHMSRGDLVFVMEEHRLTPKSAVGETGVVTYRSGQETGYRRFGQYGDVIIFKPNGKQVTPIIHRARFWVEDGENWYQEANPAYIENADNCEEMLNCPAPHAGFITKGDHNQRYDQVIPQSEPVKPAWIKGTAEVRIPWLGHIRLKLTAIRQ